MTLPTEEKNQLPFRDLTLSQVMWLFTYHPGATLRRLFSEISLPREVQSRDEYEEEIALPQFEALVDLPAPREPVLPAVDLSSTFSIRYILAWFGLLLAIGAISLGAKNLWDVALDPVLRSQEYSTSVFWVFWLIAGGLYVSATIIGGLDWWLPLGERLGGFQAPQLQPLPDLNGLGRELITWIERHSVRLALIPVAAVMVYLSYTENVRHAPDGKISAIVLTTTGTIAWGLSILLWFGILGLDLNGMIYRFYRWLNRPTRLHISWRPGWQHAVLLLIVLVAGYFRLHDLSGVPPDMTSDHIEKLLDSAKVYDGYYAVFFENNGGREAFQMYFVAALVKFFGQDFSFDTLKLATVIEGLFTVGLIYWLGIVMMGQKTPEDREMGIWLGLGLAGLLAISYWHIMLSRLALRIVLTPLTTVLILLFLIPAMRFNRRRDWVTVGFWLGAGMYFYQSNRMLPLVVIAGAVLAGLAHLMLLKWQDSLRYGLNLICAALMAMVVFVPMYHYGQEFPDSFWNRTRGRMFGENAFVRQNPDTGVVEAYEPSIREQADRFLDEFDKFRENYINALEMWSWSGDGAWINNANNLPALDPYTDGLFVLGLIAWLVLILRKRDMAYILVPVGIVIMLLPSAMTIAYPIENPSFTRASGTIPFVFLMAAYPLAQLFFYARRTTRYPTLGVGISGLVVIGLFALAGNISFDNYYTTYRDSYARSWKPYNEFAAPLREFANGEGSYGNGFLIAYPHWLDHRIIAVSAGDIRWNNGLVNREDVYGFIARNEGTPYQYDPTRPLFFMYNALDTDTHNWLKRRFPGGTEYIRPIKDRPELTFNYYIAPPGYAWLHALIEAKTLEGYNALDIR